MIWKDRRLLNNVAWSFASLTVGVLLALLVAYVPKASNLFVHLGIVLGSLSTIALVLNIWKPNPIATLVGSLAISFGLFVFSLRLLEEHAHTSSYIYFALVLFLVAFILPLMNEALASRVYEELRHPRTKGFKILAVLGVALPGTAVFVARQARGGNNIAVLFMCVYGIIVMLLWVMDSSYRFFYNKP
ncbi:MAG: hypothetical protein KIS85_03480 [Anaerolineales bacterium]|nr:hypothetical protein [Anaerolineales bacterium]